MNGETAGTVSYSFIDNGFFINNKFFKDTEELKTALLEIEKTVDIRTRDERNFYNSIEDINRMIKDPSFRKYLNNKGFFINAQPREDNDYLYFDILPAGKEEGLIGSFSINKHTGMIYLTDFEEIPIKAINQITSSSDDNYTKKKI